MGLEFLQEQTEKRIIELNVGDRFISNSRMISGAVVDQWNILFGVTNPLFFSDDYAQKMGYERRIVPALFTFTFLFMSLLASTGLFHGGVYLGMDKSKFPLPVYVGDTLRAEIEVLSKNPTSKGDRIVIRNRLIGRNQDHGVVAEADVAEMFRTYS